MKEATTSFSYGIFDFLKEKWLGISEWVWLLIYVFFGRNTFIGIILGALAGYFLVRWKRQMFFRKGVAEWKSTGGILFGANVVATLILMLVSTLVTYLASAV